MRVYACFVFCQAGILAHYWPGVRVFYNGFFFSQEGWKGTLLTVC